VGNVKTAISLNELLFQRAEQLADQMNISRSRLFALAIEEFIARYQGQQLLDAVNAAYGDGLDGEDKLWLDWGLAQQAKRLEQDEW
jgi:predicted transcriptional regulator